MPRIIIAHDSRRSRALPLIMAPSNNYISSSHRAAPAHQDSTEHQQHRRASQDYRDPSGSDVSPYESSLTPEFKAQWDSATPIPSNQYSGSEYERAGPSSHTRRYSKGGQRSDTRRGSGFDTTSREKQHTAGSSTVVPQGVSRSYSARARGTTREIESGEEFSQPIEPEVNRSHRRSNSKSAAVAGRSEAQDHNTTVSIPGSHSGHGLPPERSGTTSSRRYSATASSPNQFRNQNDSVSSEGSAQQRRDWAPDKSPLQNLERTFNDISKEEKRARVEEAELAARAARGSRGGSRPERGASQRKREGDPRGSTAVSKQIAADRPPATDSRRLEPQDQQSHPDTVQRRGSRRESQSYFEEATHTPERVPSEPVRGPSFRERTGHPRTSASTGAGAVTAARKDPNESHPRERQRTQAYDMGNRRSKHVPDAQKALQTDRTARPLTGDSAGSYGGHPDPVPREQVRNANGPPKYQIPPQTEAGLEARDRVLENSESPDPAPKKHHHLTDYLHHGRHRRGKSADRTYRTSMDPDDWRQGGTARLTAADFTLSDGGADHGNTWWEGGESGQRGPNSDSRRGDARAALQTLDGGHEEHTGMRSYSIPHLAYNSADHLPEMRRRMDSIAIPRARQYIGYEGTSSNRSRVRRRNRLWFSLSASSRAEAELPRSWSTAISSPYSYSCPQLSEHDIFHPSHICPPDTDRELIMAMRDIRVRTVPDSTTFKPPLYLKCGPLLRYTGLRQESGTQTARSGKPTTSREMWRGSVMIVTTVGVHLQKALCLITHGT